MLGLAATLAVMALAFGAPPLVEVALEARARRLVREYVDYHELYRIARDREDWLMATIYLDRMLEIEHALFWY